MINSFKQFTCNTGSNVLWFCGQLEKMFPETLSYLNKYTMCRLQVVMFTLENHCTRTAQSSRGVCSRLVHKIVYLTVKKGHIFILYA